MHNEYSQIDRDEEIDLIELFNIVWNGRKTIFKFVFVFGLIGLFVAVFSEKEYTAKVVVVPQVSGGVKPGNLGGLAAMAGINIGGGTSKGISPKLYPIIVSSIPFKRTLIKTPLNIEGHSESISYQEYYEKYYTPSMLSSIKKYTLGLPFVILKLFKKEQSGKESPFLDSIYKTSSVENRLFAQIGSQLKLGVLDDEGIVNLSYSMPEPLAAAQMTRASQELLQDIIIDFKINKLKEEVSFIKKRYDEVKKNYLLKQSRLANFTDRNQGFIRLRSQTKQQQLQAEFNLSYSIYSELAKQLETQKIKLKENTPVFTTIDPISVPVEKTKPKRIIIMIISLFLAFVLGVITVLGKEFLFKLKIKKND